MNRLEKVRYGRLATVFQILDEWRNFRKFREGILAEVTKRLVDKRRILGMRFIKGKKRGEKI